MQLIVVALVLPPLVLASRTAADGLVDYHAPVLAGIWLFGLVSWAATRLASSREPPAATPEPALGRREVDLDVGRSACGACSRRDA